MVHCNKCPIEDHCKRANTDSLQKFPVLCPLLEAISYSAINALNQPMTE